MGWTFAERVAATEATPKLAGADAPPPGAEFVTTTGAASFTGAEATSEAGMLAEMAVEALETNPLPAMARVKPPCPATVPQGESPEIAGTGLLCATSKLTELLPPPPGDGFTTVTG